jgi:hypothetical protein
MRQYTLTLTGIFLTAVAVASADETHRYTLTDSSANTNVEIFRLDSRAMPFDSSAPWSVEKRTLRGGRQEGVELVTIDNGYLCIAIIPTRGMNVYEVTHGATRLGWDSPTKEIVHPHFINLESRGGLGWLDGFNEWMVRCGLEFAGHPGTDVLIDDSGAETEMDLTLHGRIGHIPASKVEVSVDSKPPHRITVRGWVLERSFNGPSLELVTEISTLPGSNELRIADTVTNRASTPREFQVIYHTNFGSSILEKGARVYTAVERVTPMNEKAAEGLDHYNQYDRPTSGYVEEVFLVEPFADRSGNCLAVLSNKAGTLGASIAWQKDELPYLSIWKNTAAIEDGYVTGIEPGTGFPFNRRVERNYGRVPKLGAGESRNFTVDFALLGDPSSVKAAKKRVERIQGGRETTVIETPPATD